MDRPKLRGLGKRRFSDEALGTKSVTTTSTVYRDYESVDSTRPSIYGGFYDDLFDERQQSAKPLRKTNRQIGVATPTTILVRFIVEQSIASNGSRPQDGNFLVSELERDVFVPSQVQSRRKVRFRVKKRQKWTPNPALGVSED